MSGFLRDFLEHKRSTRGSVIFSSCVEPISSVYPEGGESYHLDMDIPGLSVSLEFENELATLPPMPLVDLLLSSREMPYRFGESYSEIIRMRRGRGENIRRTAGDYLREIYPVGDMVPAINEPRVPKTRSDGTPTMAVRNKPFWPLIPWKMRLTVEMSEHIGSVGVVHPDVPLKDPSLDCVREDVKIRYGYSNPNKRLSYEMPVAFTRTLKSITVFIGRLVTDDEIEGSGNNGLYSGINIHHFEPGTWYRCELVKEGDNHHYMEVREGDPLLG